MAMEMKISQSMFQNVEILLDEQLERLVRLPRKGADALGNPRGLEQQHDAVVQIGQQRRLFVVHQRKILVLRGGRNAVRRLRAFCAQALEDLRVALKTGSQFGGGLRRFFQRRSGEQHLVGGDAEVFGRIFIPALADGVEIAEQVDAPRDTVSAAAVRAMPVVSGSMLRDVPSPAFPASR